ncbi:MAG TPA: DUF308 domain-containing protein [Acidimicrobiia bacterium]|nr:DUF308 domain-containing protein [Acidimicrobiia bacterium]
MLTLALVDWRIIALRAVAAIAFGILTLIWPGLTLWALVILFGAYVLVDGVFAIVDVVRAAPAAPGRRGWLIFEGIAGIVAGVLTFAWPGITALALLYLIAAWAFVVGVIRIAAAIEYRRVVPHAWLPTLSGVLSIVFGALLVISPGAGALVITWLIGWYAVVFGVVGLAVAARARSLEREGGSLVLRVRTSAT